VQGHLRAVEASRSISTITAGFFHSLDVHASKLTSILEETQGVQDQQLLDLEKKFEVIPMIIMTFSMQSIDTIVS
jgi:kinesin family protein 11